MSGTDDYKKTRFQEDIKRIQRDISTLEYEKTRTVRDEQFQLEKIKAEYKTRVSRADERIATLERELSKKEGELKRLELSLRNSGVKKLSAAEQEKERRRQRQQLY